MLSSAKNTLASMAYITSDDRGDAGKQNMLRTTEQDFLEGQGDLVSRLLLE